MEERQRSAITIARVQSHPSDRIVDLFQRAFPKHPVSRLDASLAVAFLTMFALDATFLVARDARTGQDVGFVVGGRAAQLDNVRRKFIRKHAGRIAFASARAGSLWNMLLARINVGKAQPDMNDAPYQLRLIAVDATARGLGIGSHLLCAFEGTMPAGSRYHAWTLASDGAVGFYLAHGFERDASVDGHVRLSKTVLPVQRSLDPLHAALDGGLRAAEESDDPAHDRNQPD